MNNPNERGVRGLFSTISAMNQIETTYHTPTCKGQQTTADETSPRPVSRRRLNPPQSHTHVQHSCRCIHVDVPGVSGC
jgi:hypothetical protein